ncbi:hypothetical protein GCM10020229_71140 [Kitasatospora albolonga]
MPVRRSPSPWAERCSARSPTAWPADCDNQHVPLELTRRRILPAISRRGEPDIRGLGKLRYVTEQTSPLLHPEIRFNSAPDSTEGAWRRTDAPPELCHRLLLGAPWELAPVPPTQACPGPSKET